MARSTPPMGLSALRQEFQKTMAEHDAKDDRRFDVLDADVKALLKLTGDQNAVLARQDVALEFIKQSVGLRTRTQEATAKAELEVRTSKRSAWWKGLITAAIAGAGYVIGHLVQWLVR